MPSVRLQISSTCSSERPRTAAIVDGLASQAFCMAMALVLTSFNAFSKLNAPAAVNAENSPRLCPATKVGLKSLPSKFAIITLKVNMAGWVTLVSFNSSAVPSNMTLLKLKLSTSSAWSKSTFATSLLVYRSFPIPGYWAPWPGNTNALLILRNIL